MLSRRTIQISALVFAGVSLAVFASSFFPGAPPHHPPRYEGSESQAANEYSTAAWVLFYGWVRVCRSIRHFVAVNLSEIFTFFVASFTGTLWWSTRQLWIAGEKQLAEAKRSSRINVTAARASIKAANAAKQAAETLPKLERPYVLIREMIATFVVITSPSGGNPVAPTVKTTFHNYGRTPANIETAVFMVRFLDHLPTDEDALPPKPLTMEGLRQEVEVVIGADKTWEQECDSWDEFDISRQQKIQTGETHLYCWGHIVYRDIFGEKHPTYFCRRYNWSRRMFEPVGGLDRNRST